MSGRVARPSGRRSINQYLNNSPQVPIVPSFLDLSLKSKERIETLAFCLRWYVVGPVGSRSMGSRRIVEGIEAVEVDFANEGERLLEVFISLSGETHDDIARETVVAARRTDLRDELEISLARVAAIHSTQRRVRAR